MTGLSDVAEGLVVRAGDVLVLRVESVRTAAEMARLKGQLDAELPGVKVVVVNAAGMAVIRSDDLAQLADEAWSKLDPG